MTHTGFSPRRLARIGGLLYLAIIVLGLVTEIGVRGSVLASDPAATAANIRSMETLWRSGNAMEFILVSCSIALTPILYVLLRPVNPVLALMAAAFNLVSLAVQAASALNLVNALFPALESGSLLFEPAQRAALATLSIKAHAIGYGVALIFFGWFCILAGRLIAKSGFLPAWIGVLMQIAGVCYLISNFSLLVAPPLAHAMFPYILLPSFVGEASLCVWMLAKGVDEARWRERAAA
jgi:hypothetical protein